MTTYDLPSIPSAVSITTASKVRNLAGLRPKRIVGDILGIGNGVNVVFVPSKFAYFISVENEVVSILDLDVTVDGVSVSVASVTESALVLSSPPADGSKVACTYYGSNVSNSEIDAFRIEAEMEVIGTFAGLYTPAALSTAPVIQKVCAYVAAAALLDEAYMTAGVPSTTGAYPPDRLRKVAWRTTNELQSGAIVLVDESGEIIPQIDPDNQWVANASYANNDRLFEVDPFNLDTRGDVTVERPNRTPFHWGS